MGCTYSDAPHQSNSLPPKTYYTFCSRAVISMASLSSIFLLLFICLCLSVVEPTMALAIPPSIQHSPSAPSLAIFSVFTTALVFSFLGAYILALVGAARASHIIGGLSRRTILRHAMGRLAFPFRFARLYGAGAGRAAPRRIPVRRGGAAYPLAVAPRNRWYG
ncbi:hypothetical protein BJV74DRAFT_865928 [Russula compacta]|nr:hypothetical protein BJV74DRAFT_865928 [Russula compacta]